MKLDVTPEARRVLAERLALALANDHQLNRKLAHRLLTLEPATGDLRRTRPGFG